MEDCYDLEGEKVLLCINVKKYKPHPDGRSRNRNGSEKDEEAIIKTFKERIYRQLCCLSNLTEFEHEIGVLVGLSRAIYMEIFASVNFSIDIFEFQ